MVESLPYKNNTPINQATFFVNFSMHLAIISPYPPAITGIGQYGYHVSRLLAQSGAFSKITVLYGGTSFLERGYLPQMEMLPGWQPNRLDIGWRIPALLRRIKPDVVWFNLGVSVFGKSPLANLSGFLSPSGTHLLGLPSVVTLHELPELADLRALKAPGGIFAVYGARLLSKLATRADVICLTMKRYVDWLSISRPGPHYLHIPIEAYNPAEMLPEPESPELLFFSTLTPFKGLENLLNAFMVLQKEYPALRLTIAGAEHTRFPNYGRQLKAQYGNLADVYWLGQVPESDIRALFQRASIVVLPYQASTGASSMLIQAASWGKAIVASDLEDIQEVKRENGLDVTFFERGQVSALIDAIRDELVSAANRHAQAEHNFLAIRRHRPEMMCQMYLEAISLALDARGSPNRIVIPIPPSPEAN
jgi:glycosyltransferase involved in cell wall biosynthesis